MLGPNDEYIDKEEDDPTCSEFMEMKQAWRTCLHEHLKNYPSGYNPRKTTKETLCDRITLVTKWLHFMTWVYNNPNRVFMPYYSGSEVDVIIRGEDRLL